MKTVFASRYFLVPILSVCLAGASLVVNSADGQKQQNTALPMCFDEKTNSSKAFFVRGSVLISPDGNHKAYATVDVQVTGNQRSPVADCYNHTKLFVAKGNQNHFDEAFDFESSLPEAQGNGIQLIDWSADSDLLLADLLTWYYGGEGWEHNIVLYSSKKNVATRKSLNSIFSEGLHKGCSADAEFLGFLSDGKLAVKAIPVSEEERNNTCVKKVEYWVIDASTFNLTPISTRPKITHKSKFQESK